MVKKLLSVGIVCALAFVLTSPAHAQLLDVETDAGLDVRGGSEREGLLDMNVDTDAQIDVREDTPQDDGNSDQTSDIEQEGETLNTDIHDSIDIRIDREDILSSDNSDEEDVTVEADIDVSTSAQVETSEDFEAFARNIIRAHTDISTVALQDNTVEVRYVEDGRLLGIIPVNVGVDVHVDMEGNVDIDYPWYRFLTALEVANIESEISSDIEAYFENRLEDATATSTATTTTDTDVEGTLSFRDRAEIVRIIIDRLSSTFTTDADVGAQVELETE